MINYYQPYILPFLQFNKHPLRSDLKCLYYHSFEDGFWDLLQNKFPNKKHLRILVPDFYCSDVLDNLKLHGISYIYYPLDKNFQISTSRFRPYLWLFRPDIVVIFNACGITSDLILNTSWTLDLPKKSWIFQDNVHNLTDPERIKFINNQHIVMDSLRKVTPFPGSRMFGPASVLNFTQSQSSLLSKYFLSSFFYYIIFRFTYITGYIFNSSKLVIWAHDYWLSKHDDIIGDSFKPQSGFSLITQFINRINYQKVQDLKNSQVKIYQKMFKVVYKSKYFYQITIPQGDYGNLHVYPLGFKGSPDMEFEKYLENHGAPVWFKFTDTPWCRNRGVIFLPLGFHMNEKKIRHLSKIFSDYSKL